MEPITDYQAKYYAHELSIQHAAGSVDRLSKSLFDASVDLNPHQINAALFALNNPLSQGAVLADEVGLGKTIEAGLVLSQYWAERKRRLIIICPASLRRQWGQELQDKFNLPFQILDAKTWRTLQREGNYNPLTINGVVIISYHYAARLEAQLMLEPWDLVVMDEAHKLRNAHRSSNKMGQSLKRAFTGRKKLLLTATPLQNSLMELYGLSSIIDEHLFGDERAFRQQYIQTDRSLSGSLPGSLKVLQNRLKGFVQRTLRKDVLEYVRYTQRKTITVPFSPTAQEQDLYTCITALLEKDESYALPKRQRHLTGLILRKLLASSTCAVRYTLETIKNRLQALQTGQVDDEEFLAQFVAEEALEQDYLEASLDECQDQNENVIDQALLEEEIAEIEHYIQKAHAISIDSKAKALLTAIGQGFEQMAAMGAPRKVIIFTESRRTQAYLAEFLAANGYAETIVTFSGTNNQPAVTGIYQQWKQANEGGDQITGSPQVDRRTALIDHFKHHAEIMIATEAAAEGVNLQFCATIINYDLPWNPQRVEQRIGRCHRYGQQFDVVVINFINQSNQADQRVLELLSEKFHLFDGVFGASDDVLGSIESGLDFEKRIQQIYDTCRTADEINSAFDALQKEFEDDIDQKMQQTRQLLLENFDEDIHDLLKMQFNAAEQRLDRVGRWFWALTQHQLKALASFDSSSPAEGHRFQLKQSINNIPQGTYQLIQRGAEKAPLAHAHTYRLNHPLGEWVIQQAIDKQLPSAHVEFDYSAHHAKITVIEALQGKAGTLVLQRYAIESLERSEEYLIFAAQTDAGETVPAEVAQKLMQLPAQTKSTETVTVSAKLQAMLQQARNNISKSVNERNLSYFEQEVNKLDDWADDIKEGLEYSIKELDREIRQVRREAKATPTLGEKLAKQKQQRKLESLRNRQRRDLFDKQDEVDERREALIETLEGKLNKKTEMEELFVIRWSVV